MGASEAYEATSNGTIIQRWTPGHAPLNVSTDNILKVLSAMVGDELMEMALV